MSDNENPQQVEFKFRLRADIAHNYRGELETILGRHRVDELLDRTLDDDEIAFVYNIDISGLNPSAAAFHCLARLFEIDQATTAEANRDEIDQIRAVFADLLQSVDRIKAVNRG